MANFVKAYIKLTQAEFGNKPDQFLHLNAGENGYTLGGIYQKANPEAFDWIFIEGVLALCEFNLERASVMLYHDPITKERVFNFFKKYYWDTALLDSVQSQVQAENIFLSGVHIGVRNAVKLAQKVVQVQQDGIIGQYSIKALNYYDDNMFKRHFDKLELENYNNLIEKNPNLEWARQGFENRVYAV